jgi:hypothetical protein
MQETKIKAWSTNAKRWLEFHEYAIDPNMMPIEIDGLGDVNILIDVDLVKNTLMKDKSGKAIYEGDNCRIQLSDSPTDFVEKIVEYENEKGGYNIFGIEPKYIEVIGHKFQSA